MPYGITGLERVKYHIFCVVCVCVGSLRYPACNPHAPYYHLWPAWLCNIFPHYLIKGTIFGKKLPNIKCAFRLHNNVYLKHFSFYEEISQILSQMSAWNDSATTGRIFVKFDAWKFLKICRENSFQSQLNKNSRYFTWKPIYIYDNISLSSS